MIVSPGSARRAAIALALWFAWAGLAQAAGGKQAAWTQFEEAEKLRQSLNGRPQEKRTRAGYERVIEAYRRVYYLAPASSKADDAVLAEAELRAEMGRALKSPKALRSAITRLEFLYSDYPASPARVEALFSIAQIYLNDLNDTDAAKEIFERLLESHPRHKLAGEARAALDDLNAAEKVAREKVARKRLPRITSIRHWTTADYTRVAIDLEDEVKYEVGRITGPDRIVFDMHDTRLASALMGKTYDLQEGLLRRIRVAQFQTDTARVVLDVADLADYSVFLLPNPYRLIIDVHGKQDAKKETPSARAEEAPAESARAEKEEPPRKIVEEPEPPRKIVEPEVTTKRKKGFEPKRRIVITEDPALEEPVSDLKEESKPTTKPTVEKVAPRAEKKKSPTIGRAARPATNGDRSLIRALGLKIGKIMIDAGHGGHDTGTIGPNGLTEKAVVLDVARRLGGLLEERLGAEVAYTREDDTFIPLETRTAMANKAGADLFVSVHANSSRDRGARGIETYYLNFTSSPEALEVAARENAVSEKSIHELQDLVKKITLSEKIEESREFAGHVQRSLHKELSAKNRRISNRGVKKAPFVVLIGANMPSILAEISFLSNPTDEKNLKSPKYRQQVAEALFAGIARYVDGLSGLSVATRRGAE